ncbi:MAG TPA: hypothetical protein VFI31_27240 [Pirellulales bacterium]|nr:hypothetical protein [Pirellulales bacterium]
MAKAKPIESASKSDIVREYLKGNPTAPVAQIVDDLKQYGISQALAQKIKYKDGPRRGRRPGKPGRKAVRMSASPAFASMETAGDERKADSIRRVAQGMGKRVRPRDVIAALRAEGIEVSFAQVGQVLKTMGMRRRRRGRKSARAGTNSARATHATAGTSISLDALIAAKKLADQLGGVQAAKQAMDALAKLS